MTYKIIVRKAIERPIPCFGNEYYLNENKCRGCTFKLKCKKASGVTLDKIPVSEVVFKTTDDKLLERYSKTPFSGSSDPDAGNVEAVYVRYYMDIFEQKERSKVKPLSKKVADGVEDAANQLGISIRLYVAIVLIANKDSNEGRPFSSYVMNTDYTLSLVDGYVEACKEKYGMCDLRALDTLRGSNVYVNTDEGRLRRSESSMCRWIIGSFRKGCDLDFSDIYRIKEQHLDVAWLSIEDVYYHEDVIEPHLKYPGECVSDELRRFRFGVTKSIAALKKHPKEALYLFKLRNRIIPGVLKEVLLGFGTSSEDLLTSYRVVNDPLDFYAEIGSALHHLECLNHVKGAHSIFSSKFR